MAYTKYSLTPANNNAAPPDGAPEGMLPSAVNDTMRDMMAQIRDCGDGIRGGTYTMTAPVITGGSISGSTMSSNVITGGSINNTPIGASTASTGAFTTLSASSTVSGTGFSNYFASPPALGWTAAAAVSSTNLSYTGTLTGGTGVINLGSGQFYKDASGNVGIGTSSPSFSGGSRRALTLNAPSGQLSILELGVNGSLAGYFYSNGSETNITSVGATPITFGANGAERMRIDSSGNVFVGGTTAPTSNSPIYASTTAKSWINFSDNGTTCTINASFNVGSITRYGTGNYGINFSNSVNSTRSCAIAQASYTDGTNSNAFINGVNTGTNGVQVISVLQANWCSVVVFS